MSKVHGKVTVVLLNGTALTVHANNHEFVRTADKHDVTTFGNDSHKYNGGLGDGTSTISGFYDNTAGTGPRFVIEPLIGTVVPLVRRPEGTGTGKPQDTVDVLVESYTETSPVADMVTWSCDLQMSGDVVTIAQA
jgi:hypothetical protein